MDLRLTRRAVTGLLVVLAVTTTAGCSDPDATPGAGDPSGRVRAAAELNAALAMQAQVEDASQRLIRKCMEEQGFTTHPQEDIAEPGPVGAYPFLDPPTVSEVTSAGGYPDTTDEPELDAGGKEPDDFGRLDDAEQQRYEAAIGDETTVQLSDGTEIGIPTGGCAGKVATELFGDIQGAFRTAVVARRGPDIAREKTAVDPTVTETMAGWSKCMEQEGFPGLADPESARELTHVKGDSSRKVDEPALAAADAGCGAEHRVSEVRRAAWDRHLAEYLREHETEIAAYRESQQSALDNAQRLLQG